MPSYARQSKSAATIRRRKLKTNPGAANSGPSSKHVVVRDELLQEDHEPAMTEPVTGPPLMRLLMSSDWVLFLGLLAFRTVNALFIQTAFVADEYWQSLEVAHHMVFGYGYLTWEWQHKIRGYSYPLLFAALYKILDLLHIDNRVLLIKLPRVLQAVFSALCDLYLYKTARKLSGDRVARWSLLCQLTSWFTFFTSVRTLTNSMETSLSTIALYFYPWPGAPRKAQWKYMFLIGLAVLIRPTAAILWTPLCAWHLWLYRQKLLKVLVLFLVTGLCLLGVSSWLDHAFYGQWTFVQYNFLRFNVLSDLSTFYGTHPWHWYLTQGFPVILGPQLFLFVLAVWKTQQPFVLALIGWTITLYSLLAHKEFRFIFPILPLAMYQCGLYLHSITHESHITENSESPPATAKLAHQDTATNTNDKQSNSRVDTSLCSGSNKENRELHTCTNKYCCEGSKRETHANSHQKQNNCRMETSLTCGSNRETQNDIENDGSGSKKEDPGSKHGSLDNSKKKCRRSFVLKSRVVIVVLIASNLPIALYTSLLHQRGTVDVMKYLHEETKYEQVNYNTMDVMFLMPCHSTPYYSYIHKNVSMRFLTCEAPVSVQQSRNYTDEADLFYMNPKQWLTNEYQVTPPEGKPPPFPTHLVMFNVLHSNISSFLEKNDYRKCAKFFHSHIREGRVGSHVIVMCLTKWTEKKERIKRQRQILHM